MRSIVVGLACGVIALGGLCPTAMAQEATVVSEGPALQPHAVKIILHSALMGRDYQIEVTAPFRGPVFPGQKAAVVYALDGGWGVAGPAGWLLGGGGAMSPAYVVTIGYPEGQANSRERDLLPRPVRRQDGTVAQGERSALFTQFLTRELRPYIEARFPVDPQRSILFGHSLAGVFTANVLADQPTAFSGYLIASPSIWADPTVIERLRDAAEGRDRPVFVGYGEREDNYMVEGGQQLAEALAARGDHVRTEVFPDAYHVTYYPAVMGRALPILLPRQAPLDFPTETDLPAATLTSLAGEFLVSGAIPLSLEASRDGLIATVPGGGRLPLKASSPSRFFSPDLDVRGVFSDDGQAIALFVNGDRIDAVRVR